jgi:hypothetical protein
VPGDEGRRRRSGQRPVPPGGSRGRSAGRLRSPSACCRRWVKKIAAFAVAGAPGAPTSRDSTSSTPSAPSGAPSASPPPRSACPSRPTAEPASSSPPTPSSSSPARWPPTCAAPGRSTPTPAGRSPLAESAGGFATSAPASAPPPVSRNPPGPALAGPREAARDRHHAYQLAVAAGDVRAMALAALGLAGLWVSERRTVSGAAQLEARLQQVLSLLKPSTALALLVRARLAAETDYRGCRADPQRLKPIQPPESAGRRALAVQPHDWAASQHAVLGARTKNAAESAGRP